MKPDAPFWRRRETWLGLLLTVVFHAGVFALVQATWPPPMAAHAAPFVPHFAYLPDPSPGVGIAVWDNDPRALGSPVLFALPTEAGFSPSPQARIQLSSPLLRDRATAGLWLDRMPVAAPTPAPLRDRTEPELEATLAQRWTRLPAIEDPFETLIPTGAVLQVEWPDGEPEIAAGLPLVLDPPPALDEKPWDATAIVFFSDGGDVSSVFMDQSTASRDRNDALVRSLWRLRVPSGYAVSTRVNLYLQRPLTPSARAPEAAP